MNELIPKYSKYNDCIENQIHTIIHSFGFENEIAYVDMMEFTFDYDKYASGNWSYLGKLLNTNDGGYTTNIKKYFNIEMYVEYCEADEVLHNIDKDLSKDMFVIVLIRRFCCPWEEVYQNPNYSEFTHGLIIKKRVGNYYLCTDGDKKIKDCKIDINDLKKGFLGNYLTIKLSNSDVHEVIWRKSIRDAAKILLTKNNNRTTSDYIHLFACAISKDLDFNKEVKGYETDLFASPLFINFYKTKNMRKKFKLYLKYIEDKFKLNLFDDIIKEVDIVSNKWGNLTTILVKYFYAPQRRYIDNVVDVLDDIAVREERIAKMMLEKSFTP